MACVGGAANVVKNLGRNKTKGRNFISQPFLGESGVPIDVFSGSGFSDNDVLVAGGVPVKMGCRKAQVRLRGSESAVFASLPPGSLPFQPKMDIRKNVEYKQAAGLQRPVHP
mgnify:CR=1 FL=1